MTNLLKNYGFANGLFGTMMMVKGRATVIIPVCNGERTILKALESLTLQANGVNRETIEAVLIVDEGSTDKTIEIIEEFVKTTHLAFSFIHHDRALGLAYSYNDAISKVQSDYFILMHQDVILGENALTDVLEPFSTSDNTLVAIFPSLSLPMVLWQNYGFWQKCMFARHVGKYIPAFAGKFDAYNRSRFLKFAEKFDEKTFRTAGEDADLAIRLKKSGGTIKHSNAKVIHWHSAEKNFSFLSWIRKEAQLNEAYGVLLRKHGIPNLHFLTLFFRPILVVALALPIINIPAIFLTLVYLFWYTWLVYRTQWRNLRTYLLPFANLLFLYLGAFFVFRGFIIGRQRI